jgi:hypothetical protein
VSGSLVPRLPAIRDHLHLSDGPDRSRLGPGRNGPADALGLRLALGIPLVSALVIAALSDALEGKPD